MYYVMKEVEGKREREKRGREGGREGGRREKEGGRKRERKTKTLIYNFVENLHHKKICNQAKSETARRHDTFFNFSTTDSVLYSAYTQINPLTAFTPIAGFGHEGIQREPRVSGNVKTRHSQCGKGLVSLIPTRALYSANHIMDGHKCPMCVSVCVCVYMRVRKKNNIILSKGHLYTDIII